MAVNEIRGLMLTLLSSVILIVIGVLYFMVVVWIISVGSSWAGYPDVEGSTVVLTAGIITAASMIGSAMQK